jgi:hypothetical protein
MHERHKLQPSLAAAADSQVQQAPSTLDAAAFAIHASILTLLVCAAACRLPVPGLETSQTFTSLQQPQQMALPATLSSGHVAQQLQQLGLSGSPPAAAAAATAAGAAGGVHVVHDGGNEAAAAAGGKCFMSALTELKVRRGLTSMQLPRAV